MLFFAQGRDAKRLRAELTLVQRGSVSDDPVGPEVAPPSVFHGHQFIHGSYRKSTMTFEGFRGFI